MQQACLFITKTPKRITKFGCFLILTALRSSAVIAKTRWVVASLHLYSLLYLLATELSYFLILV